MSRSPGLCILRNVRGALHHEANVDRAMRIGPAEPGYLDNVGTLILCDRHGAEAGIRIGPPQVELLPALCREHHAVMSPRAELSQKRLIEVAAECERRANGMKA